MELVLQNPEKTTVEILEAIYAETGSTYVCSALYYYLKRYIISRERRLVCQLFAVKKPRCAKPNVNFLKFYLAQSNCTTTKRRC